MKGNAFLRWTAAFAVLVFAFVVSSTVLAGEFTADMSEVQGDHSKSSKLIVKGSKYRIELSEGGMELVVLIDQEAGKAIVMIVSDKEYRELAIDDMMVVMNDPIQAYKYTAAMGEESPAGAETLDGYECEKTIVTMMDTEVRTRWLSTKLGFPIKIFGKGPPDMVMTLSNIVEGPVDDALFSMPDGFTKWIDPETLPKEPPEWAVGIAAAPVMTPPFVHDMSAGDIVRIKPEPGKAVKVKGTSKTDAEATAKAMVFKGERPLKEESWYNNFAMRGVICQTLWETQTEADEFVVHVNEGDITVETKWLELVEKTVAAGEEIRLPIVGFDNIKCHMVNMSDGESVTVLSYNQQGAPLSDEDLGPIKWRTIEIKEPGEVDSRTLSIKGDEMVMKVEKGKILFKLAQHDSFEF